MERYKIKIIFHPSIYNKCNSLSDVIYINLANQNLTDQPKPDIYAIGFEELVDLSASNIIGAR